MLEKSAIIPCLRYKDAPAAIRFLCEAFGFTRHAVYADEKDPNIIHHAQLVIGNNMIMLGSDRESPAKDLYHWLTPDEARGITMCICMHVDDPDAHAEHAARCGAVIIQPPYDNQATRGVPMTPKTWKAISGISPVMIRGSHCDRTALTQAQ
ncbi:glyoxalase/bleomycin resistance protein/dioxygenase [Advenella kashmirensis WT001]|uniref:Glyoxalase/bleomycin resistance protein/dioxygenase n=1 Tax=Advenella kashmirensis (strain DSM 17095 / LMG 22695 / WT001) TaxID=1036672 RepID=I3UGS4_ADVKW|nr:VOC family protein [Advenella kashmirensis]AFK64212.1 glyoxalase/bleomycin resistance protein/dioxygenase [Advenella kashmirensis WT001]